MFDSPLIIVLEEKVSHLGSFLFIDLRRKISHLGSSPFTITQEK